MYVQPFATADKHRGWAQCAAVCKEWQTILEPKNFAQLALEPSCLDDLETLVIRQRPLVQHICLNIDLPRYACRVCKRNDSMSSHRSTIISRAILRLFSILSTWQPTGRLTLELSASSPNTRDWTQQEKAIRWHDPKHGWVDGQQVKTPSPPAIMRLFSPLCLNVPQSLPVLRHELFPEVLKALWEKLPRLESIVYELWRPRRHHYQIACAYELVFLVQRSVPKHVKRVSIFKDFNNQLTLALNNAMPHLGRDIGTTSAVNLKLAKAFAAKSHHLEHLSISYKIDAQQFFTSCQQLPCTWNLLHSLTLTSSTLARTVPHQYIYTLLRNASSIALRMPQLKTMVLWNSEPRQACAVIHQQHTASAMGTLTWRGTWNLELSDDDVESWKKVAPGPCYLRLEKEALHDVDSFP
ncbi:hypothetical protein T440DRAFT_496075 [Plenodomus tracheiphilus IPT5]|uniref:DUF6546 domain-containing protein n=1 Tax=Plenodomus tracheiphilus IPT5 TaxID=1408161 RepID=A0A6A7BGP3_9PLEO|nr:hypothetical protein T440DRAFT_496075 [Plenodomus tracheiphilus IPT5]